jgi:hypothetical protein
MLLELTVGLKVNLTLARKPGHENWAMTDPHEPHWLAGQCRGGIGTPSPYSSSGTFTVVQVPMCRQHSAGSSSTVVQQHLSVGGLPKALLSSVVH